MEMTHEAMIARWYEGLVTPMSSTITTFAKTDGSWWTANQSAWLRVPLANKNEQLDFHHERFGVIEQAKGPGHSTGRSPWEQGPLAR
jgi:hypothetical protein